MPRNLSFLEPIYPRTRLRDLWMLDRHEVPDGNGVYILLTGDGTDFTYPGGRSPVFYIGQSKNLRNRLQDHLQFATEARDHRRYPLYFQVYEYAARFGCRYTCISALSWDTPKELEADVMALFAKKSRCWPAANGVGSWDFVE